MKYVKSSGSDLFFLRAVRDTLLVVYKGAIPESRVYRYRNKDYPTDALNITRVGRLANITRTSAVKNVYKLEEHGLVRIHNMGKYNAVVITAKGEQVSKQILKINQLLGGK